MKDHAAAPTPESPTAHETRSRSERKKVLVLGAGPAGLTAAHGLSNTPELRARYEVHVYQVGWRAGGKVTSGRKGIEKRIQQNGTHYLFGCYDNSFKVAKDIYTELDAHGIEAFGRFEDAFHPVTMLSLKHYFRGEWTTWLVEIPTNRQEPGGDGGVGPRFVDLATMGIQWMIELLAGWEVLDAVKPRPPFAPGGEPAWWRRLVGPIEDGIESVVNGVVGEFLELAQRLAKRLVGGPAGEREAAEAISWLLRQARSALWEVLGSRVETDLEACRRWMLVDVGLSSMIGILEDDVFGPGGLAAIDHYDFREWLIHHGASELGAWSPLVTAWYDSIASYEGGDTDKPNVSAGVTINALYRAGLTYKGAFAYQPARELGDSFVGPLYAALRARGVHFHFFRRVRDLIPDGDRIGTLVVEEQAAMREPGVGIHDYEPFIEVNGLNAWPDRPKVDQLDWGFGKPPGEGPITDPYEDVDLEDFYTPFRGPDIELHAGKDFDEVVWAMPIESLRAYASQVLEVQPSWRRMVESVAGNDTQSLWLYFRRDLEELGWDYPPPILTSFAKPFSTWESTTYLVEAENWPPGEVPRCVNSMFGAMKGPRFAPPADDPGGYPERQRAQAEADALHFATEQVGSLWPKATQVRDPLCLDWNLLVDLENREGRARFDFQTRQANYGPIQRYTLALAGTLDARLRADETSYRNLTFAGDWTRNGAIVGSVEGAVASGLLAAIAISGVGHVIGYDPDNGLA